MYMYIVFKGEIFFSLSFSQASSFQAREIALQNDLKAKSELAAGLKEEMRNLKDEVDLMKKKLQVCIFSHFHFQLVDKIFCSRFPSV